MVRAVADRSERGGVRGDPCSKAIGSGACAGTIPIVEKSAAAARIFSNRNSTVAVAKRFRRRPEAS